MTDNSLTDPAMRQSSPVDSLDLLSLYGEEEEDFSPILVADEELRTARLFFNGIAKKLHFRQTYIISIMHKGYWCTAVR